MTPPLDRETLQAKAEEVFESLAQRCICQNAEVGHWCESCQRDISIIKNALATPPREEPTLVDEGDGEIALDWDRDNRRVLSLSIGQTGIGYSYLMGRETGSGRVTFGMVMPERVIEVLRELSQPEPASPALTPGVETRAALSHTAVAQASDPPTLMDVCRKALAGLPKPSPEPAQDGVARETEVMRLRRNYNWFTEEVRAAVHGSWGHGRTQQQYIEDIKRLKDNEKVLAEEAVEAQAEITRLQSALAQVEQEIAEAREACPSGRIQDNFDAPLIKLVNLEVLRGFNRDAELSRIAGKLKQAEADRDTARQEAAALLARISGAL